ncbi:MAG TPA: accessory factor UbiK family protein [Alphaproteobacteria bacterium]|nr:accessory factor UbiK family protein [Alphaproteobacteria bacterium]
MRKNQTLIEDMVSLGGAVLGNLAGARHEFRAQAKQHLGGLAQQLDLVSRAEFDAAFAMLAKARAMQEDLNDRLSEIEAHLNLSRKNKTKSATKLNLPSVKNLKRAKKHF